MAKDRFNNMPGTANAQGWQFPRLHHSLVKAAQALPTKTKPEKQQTRPIKIPDETVLAIRRLHRDGKSPREIERMYPDLRPETIRQFITYQTRSNLLLPEDKVKKRI